MCLHHLSGLCIIPMNLHYYNEYYYWEMIALLQFVAGGAHALSEYIYLLDVKTKTGLRKMQIVNTLGFFFVLWARGIQFLWVLINLFLITLKDLSMLQLCGSIVIIICFSAFNLFACIIPFYKRMIKFNRMSIGKNKKVDVKYI